MKNKRATWTRNDDFRNKMSEIAHRAGYGKWMVGKKHTKETLIKMSLQRKGHPTSESTKMKISISQKGKPRITVGERHGMFKGGGKNYLTKFIKQRDNFTCQICGLRDEDIIEVDHKMPKKLYPNLAKDKSNLWCLCPNCHRRKTNKEKRETKNYQILIEV